MSKELTPLQALSDLREISGWNKEELNKRLSIIENALKEYALMKEIRITARFDLAQVNEEHKALEIIKEKRVNVDNFIRRIKKDTDYKEYKRLCGLYKITIFSGKDLTEEEFELLKEVLKNETIN